MEISCPKCRSLYPFEENKIPGSGLLVKCESCDNVFRIWNTTQSPQGAILSSPEKDRLWLIARTNGESLKCRQLTTLQQWIIEGKVKREDRISVSGETWKTLGSIPELEKLFQMQDDAALGRTIRESGAVMSPSASAPTPTPTPDIPVVAVLPGIPTASAAASGAATATVAGGSEWEDVAREIREKRRATPPVVADSSAIQRAIEATEAPVIPSTVQAFPPPTQPMKQTPSGSWVKDDIQVERQTAIIEKPRRSRRLWPILLVVFGLGLALGYAYFATRNGQQIEIFGKQIP